MTFCIYSGFDVTDSPSSIEHIFPLTLGGSDAYTINVSKSANTLANKELDEKLKTCLFLAVKRKKHQAQGHRKTTISPPKTKITVGTDQSVVFKFDENNLLQLYSNRRKKIITSNEIKTEGAVFSIKQERILRLKFTAKVALAAGYFTYGNVFVENTKTEELRALMSYMGARHDDYVFNSINSTGWYWPQPVGDSDAVMHSIFQRMNDMFDSSFVALITSAVPDKIIAVVGVLGHLTGVISCPANCDAFPKSGNHDLGHVAILRSGQLQTMSFRNCLQQVLEHSNDSLG